MQYRALVGFEDAYRFDLLCAKLQLSYLKSDAEFEGLKDQMQEQVGQLPVNLQQVQVKLQWIHWVRDAKFWTRIQLMEGPAPYLMAAEPQAPYGTLPPGPVDVHRLEEIRRELRGIMHCCNRPKVTAVPALHIDVTDTEELSRHEVLKLDGLDLAAYRHRVEHVLKELMAQSEVLRKIHAGQAVSREELTPLIEAVLLQEPDLNVEDLLVHYPNRAGRLDLAIRQIIGLDAEAVDGVFSDEQQIDDLLDLINNINELAPGENA